MKNEFEVRGEITAVILNSEKYGRIETIISTSDLKKAMSFPNLWGVKRDTKSSSFYVYGRISKKNKQRTYLLHRWILDAEPAFEVDHINNNTLDNRASNLRILKVAENQQNLRGAKKTSSSGKRNVHWHKGCKKWEVQIRVNGRKMVFGYFDDLEEADTAAQEARRRHMPYSKENAS